MSTRSEFPILLFANFIRDGLRMILFTNVVHQNQSCYYEINPTFQWYGPTYRAYLEARLMRTSSFPGGPFFFSVGSDRFVTCDGLLAHVTTGNILVCNFIDTHGIRHVWVSSELDSVKTKFTALRKTWRKIRSYLINGSDVYIHLKDQETMNSCKHTISFHFKSLPAVKQFKQELLINTLVKPTRDIPVEPYAIQI